MEIIEERTIGPSLGAENIAKGFNNATETTWFQLLLERFPVCLPARRLAFWRHDHANVGARQGQAFFYLGPNVAKFQEVFSQFGPILRRLS